MAMSKSYVGVAVPLAREPNKTIAVKCNSALARVNIR